MPVEADAGGSSTAARSATANHTDGPCVNRSLMTARPERIG